MLTTRQLYADLLKLTVKHESDCMCTYCKRRRVMFGRIIFRNILIFFGVTISGVVLLFLAFYAHGDIILSLGGFEFLVLMIMMIVAFVLLAIANALE